MYFFCSIDTVFKNKKIPVLWSSLYRRKTLDPGILIQIPSLQVLHSYPFLCSGVPKNAGNTTPCNGELFGLPWQRSHLSLPIFLKTLYLIVLILLHITPTCLKIPTCFDPSLVVREKKYLYL